VVEVRIRRNRRVAVVEHLEFVIKYLQVFRSCILCLAIDWHLALYGHRVSEGVFGVIPGVALSDSYCIQLLPLAIDWDSSQ
jgi:hypothetical protein